MKQKISTKEKIDTLHKLKERHPGYARTIDEILKMYKKDDRRKK